MYQSLSKTLDYYSAGKPVLPIDDINTSSNQMGHLPWQQLLVMPPRQVIVVERMQSGARRHVTLDFGKPVLLTDIIIPSCSDLVTASIDIWLKGEDVDEKRLVVATDIGTRNLLLTDLQPPPLCRYVKVMLQLGKGSF